jgi:large subunit ribosomal protein L29
MDKIELKNLDTAALVSELASLRKELFNLKLSLLSGQVKNTSQFEKLRRQIARVQTFLKQKQMVATKE